MSKDFHRQCRLYDRSLATGRKYKYQQETPADCASLLIEAIAESVLPQILQSVNERLPDLVTNILSQKDFVPTAGNDESDKEESSQQTSNCDINAGQTEKYDCRCPEFGEEGYKYPTNYQKSRK